MLALGGAAGTLTAAVVGMGMFHAMLMQMIVVMGMLVGMLMNMVMGMAVGHTVVCVLVGMRMGMFVIVVMMTADMIVMHMHSNNSFAFFVCIITNE